jgi:PiT family inorganic phosphate transporter
MTNLFALIAAESAGGNHGLVITVAIVAIALFFDFCNGFHDSANSIATIVATRALSPKHAVVWAAFFNFVAVALLPMNVAATMATGIVDPSAATNMVVFSALIGAIAWDLITWYFGIPSSSSHALIGGFVGAGFAFGGTDVVLWGSLVMPLLGIVLAPTFCLTLGYLTMVAILWICRKKQPEPVNRVFKYLQFVAAAIYSISHGANDAQKTIGIIVALLLGEGFITAAATAPAAGEDPAAPGRAVPQVVEAGVPGTPQIAVDGQEQKKDQKKQPPIPLWVIISAFSAITLGTLSGGWRIVKTMGTGITKLRPVDGFAAAMAGGVMIMGFTEIGLPVSTTHSIAGSIMGVGATKGLSAVKWGMSARIIWAWVLTIPASAVVSIVTFWLVDAIF